MNAAFVTTLDDRYVSGFVVTLFSMLRCSKHFDWNVIILEWGKLSEQNKQLIRELYSKVIFKSVDTTLYENNAGQDEEIRKWNYNCNYRFDIFALSEYDKIVYFDCDILFEINAKELIDLEVDFGACLMPTYTQYNQVLHSKIFNAGLMIIGKRFLNNKTRQELIDLSNTVPPPAKDIISNKWFGNQPILNNYFFSYVTYLPQKYNFLTEDLTVSSFNIPMNLHYIGTKKPWIQSSVNESFDEFVVEAIKDKTDNIVLRNMIVKKAYQKASAIISEVLIEYPKIPFFDSFRKETHAV